MEPPRIIPAVAPPHSRSSNSSTTSTNDRPHTRRRMFDELLEPVPPLRHICTTASTTRVSRGTQATSVEVSRNNLHNQEEEQQQHRIVWNQRTISEQLQLSSVWLPSAEHSSFLPPPGHRVDCGDDAPLQAPPRRQNNMVANLPVAPEEQPRSETRLSQPTETFSRQQSLLSLDAMSISTELENLYNMPSNRSVCSFGPASTGSSHNRTSGALIPPHLLRLTSQSSARPSKPKLERQTSTGADSWWSAGTCNSHHLYKPTSEIRLTHHHHHHTHHHRSSSATSIASSYHPGRCRRPTNPMAELMMCQHNISSNSQRSLCSSIVSTTTTSCFSTTNVASCESTTASSAPPNPPFGTMYAASSHHHHHHHTSCTSTTTTTTTHHNHRYNHSEDRAAHHRSSIPMEDNDPSVVPMQMDALDGTIPSPLPAVPAAPPESSASYRPPLPLQALPVVVPRAAAAPRVHPSTGRPVHLHRRSGPERAASSTTHSSLASMASSTASPLSASSSFLEYGSRLMLAPSDAEDPAAVVVVPPPPSSSSSRTDASGRVRRMGRRGSL